jgi:hypothetical protein
MDPCVFAIEFQVIFVLHVLAVIAHIAVTGIKVTGQGITGLFCVINLRKGPLDAWLTI